MLTALLLPAYADPPDDTSGEWFDTVADPWLRYSTRLSLWIITGAAIPDAGLRATVRDRLVEQLAAALVEDYRESVAGRPNHPERHDPTPLDVH